MIEREDFAEQHAPQSLCASGRGRAAQDRARPGHRRDRHRRRGQVLARRRDRAAVPAGLAATRRVAVLSVDPSRRLTGGALLGDRIRMNSLPHPRGTMRSFATRGARGRAVRGRRRRRAGLPARRASTGSSSRRRASGRATPRSPSSPTVSRLRHDAGVRRPQPTREDRHARLRRPRRREQGGPARRRGRAARRAQAGRAQPQGLRGASPRTLGVYGTVASRFCDPGRGRLLRAPWSPRRRPSGGAGPPSACPTPSREADAVRRSAPGTIPPDRVGYLAEIVRTVRGYREWAEEQIRLARDGRRPRGRAGRRRRGDAPRRRRGARPRDAAARPARARPARGLARPGAGATTQDVIVYEVRGKVRETRGRPTRSLAGLKIPKVVLPPDGGARARSCASCCSRTSPGASPSPAACSPSSAPTRIPSASSPARGRPPARTAASTT